MPTALLAAEIAAWTAGVAILVLVDWELVAVSAETKSLPCVPGETKAIHDQYPQAMKIHFVSGKESIMANCEVLGRTRI